MHRHALRHSGTTHRVVAAAVDRRGTIIDITTNAPRLFSKGGGVHAEVRILRRNPPTVQTVYIARFGKSGRPLPIHPCESCQRLASKLGIQILPLTPGEK